MRNIIEELANKLPKFVQDIEKSLQDTYAIKDFDIEITSRLPTFLFTLSCSDTIFGYVFAYGNNYDSVLHEFVSKLTKHSDIREKRLAKIAELTKELYGE